MSGLPFDDSMSETSSVADEERVKKLFQACDYNGDGYIDRWTYLFCLFLVKYLRKNNKLVLKYIDKRCHEQNAKNMEW